MKNITLPFLRDIKACYNPREVGFTGDLSLTPVEFIDQFRDKVKEKEDVIWLLCRNDFLTDRELILFAVWCAREALKLVDTPDERSIKACNVSERYANGKADKEELDAAGEDAKAAAEAAARVDERDAAWAAAWTAARVAARDAARVAAEAAAKAAARVAARDAAKAAAEAAAWAAARDDARDDALAAAEAAAWAAAKAAWDAARDATWAAARVAARDAQIDELRRMLKLKES